MWSCAIPHSKVVQPVPCTCSALEYQLQLGGYKQRTSLLNSGILDSTCVPSRKEEEDRGEGHPTCEACRPYMHVLYINTMTVHWTRLIVVGIPQVGFTVHSHVQLYADAHVGSYQQSSFCHGCLAIKISSRQVAMLPSKTCI